MSRRAGTILRLFEALNLVAETVTHPHSPTKDDATLTVNRIAASLPALM